ncbi:MAG: hypothetical protein KF861_21895, partial [Planctomycetaceae bacterium]|nr:hypothetical protein [Planctomycetaceae bacterium]
PGKVTSLDELQRVHCDMVPLRERYLGGLHGEGSLLRKSLPTILTAEQLSVIREREREHYRELVKTVVLSIANTMSVTADEYEQIVVLVMEQTKAIPPYQSLPDANKNDLTIVQQQMARMESDLKLIVGDRRWKQMQRILQPEPDVKRAIRLREMGDRVIFFQ